jgi:hypothetical protein
MKKIEQIRTLLDKINEDRVEKIRSEIKKKESFLINTVSDERCPFDVTHTDMVLDNIRDNKIPTRPETLNKLMIQFISSAFSYNRIRKQFRKINRLKFNDPNYPIREVHEKILAYLLCEERFLEEEFWHPQKLEVLIKEIESKGHYKKLQIISGYWLEHIMCIFRTAPPRLMELTKGNLSEFYQKVDGICNNDYHNDIFRKSEELWGFTKEVSLGIKNVGSNLICDFLKESGFPDYAKMDIHLIRSMSETLNVNNCSKLSDFESFIVAQWLADKIKMTPFKLDKILYVYGVYQF